MPATNVKPMTEAALTADHRKAYRQYDDDAKRYGVRVADYNAGFVRGWTDGKKKGIRAARSPRRKP